VARGGKERTYEQAAAMQQKAVKFLRDLIKDEDKANEIEGLSVGEYADRKGLVLINPARGVAMSRDETPASLVHEVDAAYKRALKAIDDYNEASEADASPQKLHRLSERADALTAHAKELREQLIGEVGDWLSEYTWERNPEIISNPAYRNFFGLFGSGSRSESRRPASGGKVKEYDAECYSKVEELDDIYPAQSFPARNKTEAKEKVKAYLRSIREAPTDYTIKVFGPGEA
jgi:hypothetical protein